MKEFTITKGLTSLFAGFIMSTTAAQAVELKLAEVSATYGDSGAYGAAFSIITTANDGITSDGRDFIIYHGRANNLGDDNYLREIDINIGRVFNENVAAYGGIGLLATDYDRKIAADSIRPIYTIGATFLSRELGMSLNVDGYIHDAHNCGVKATLPLYMYAFEDGRHITFGAYAEANKIELEKQSDVKSISKDTKIVRNIGLQVSVKF